MYVFFNKEMSRAPFSKRPPSKSAKEEFYWRGGDSLREKEYLKDEYKKAVADYRKAQMEYQKVEQDLQKTNEQLKERESYTNALSSYLDNDTEGSTQEQEYKKKLVELESEIKKAEEELSEARAVQHPAVISGLQKEKAFMMIEIQRQSKSLDLRDEQNDANKKQLAACVVSQKYHNALLLEGEIEKLSRKRAFLRSQVNKRKQEYDALTSQGNHQQQLRSIQQINKEERQAGIEVAELELIKGRLLEREQRRVNKWNMETNRYLKFIEELNQRMKDIGIEDQVEDVEALREKYIIKKEESEEKKEGAEGENKEEDKPDEAQDAQ